MSCLSVHQTDRQFLPLLGPSDRQMNNSYKSYGVRKGSRRIPEGVPEIREDPDEIRCLGGAVVGDQKRG